MGLKQIIVKIGKKAFDISYVFGLQTFMERIRFFGIQDRPHNLFIEPTNKCNLNCIMCPREKLKRKQGIMSMELYKKVVDEASELGISYIRLNRFGEPLLHPQIFEMAKYAKEKGLKNVGFSSNGVLLTKKKAKELLDSGMDYVNFSIDSLNPETYKNIRIGATLKPTLNNILYFLKLKKEGNYKKPFVSISALDIDSNHDEIEDIKKFWRDKVDEVVIQTFVSYEGGEKLSDVKFIKKHACNQPFERLMILQDGKVIVCCDDFNGKILVGDINKESIKQIWNSKRVKKIQKIQLKHEFEKIPACVNCDSLKHEIIDLSPPNTLWSRLTRRF